MRHCGKALTAAGKPQGNDAVRMAPDSGAFPLVRRDFGGVRLDPRQLPLTKRRQLRQEQRRQQQQEGAASHPRNTFAARALEPAALLAAALPRAWRW